MIIFWIIGIILWILAAVLVAKLSAVLVGEKTEISDIIISLFLWYIFAVLLLTTKHHINNCGKDEWGY